MTAIGQNQEHLQWPTLFLVQLDQTEFCRQFISTHAHGLVVLTTLHSAFINIGNGTEQVSVYPLLSDQLSEILGFVLSWLT